MNAIERHACGVDATRRSRIAAEHRWPIATRPTGNAQRQQGARIGQEQVHKSGKIGGFHSPYRYANGSGFCWRSGHLGGVRT